MSTITVEEVTRRLHALSSDQLLIVDDFVATLIVRSHASGKGASVPNERPVVGTQDLLFDFWPADESVDDFLQAREAWRVQDLARILLTE